MSTKKMPLKGKSLPVKIGFIVIITVCLVLGIIGLILPVIPGLLFLALAVIFASKLSRRVAKWANQSPLYQRWSKHQKSVDALSISQRLKLAFWVGAKYTVESLSTLTNRLGAIGHGK